MPVRRILLIPGKIYHLHSYAVGSEKIFREDENYDYFLRNFRKKTSKYIDILAYCLLPNTFQLAVKIKTKDKLVRAAAEKIALLTRRRLINNQTSHELLIYDQIIVSAISNLLNSYVQAFNKAFDRKGTLLRTSFRREQIAEAKIQDLICSIHNLPKTAGYSSEWPHSSYQEILNQKCNWVNSREVLKIFGGSREFISRHK